LIKMARSKADDVPGAQEDHVSWQSLLCVLLAEGAEKGPEKGKTQGRLG